MPGELGHSPPLTDAHHAFLLLQASQALPAENTEMAIEGVLDDVMPGSATKPAAPEEAAAGGDE